MNRHSFLIFGGTVLIFILALIWSGANKLYQPPTTEIKMDIITDNDACASANEDDRQICLRGVEQTLFENYLKENISDLSPTKEVLGGKFYITNISWLPDRVALVDYEDGHIALQARVSLNAKYQDAWPETVEVKSFELLNK